MPHARCGPLIPALRGEGSQVSKSEAGQGCTEKLSPKPNKQDRCPKLGGTHLDPQHREVRAGGTGLKQPQLQNEFNAGDQNQAITFGSEKLFPSHGLTFFFLNCTCHLGPCLTHIAEESLWQHGTPSMPVHCQEVQSDLPSPSV